MPFADFGLDWGSLQGVKLAVSVWGRIHHTLMCMVVDGTGRVIDLGLLTPFCYLEAQVDPLHHHDASKECNHVCVEHVVDDTRWELFP